MRLIYGIWYEYDFEFEYIYEYMSARGALVVEERPRISKAASLHGLDDDHDDAGDGDRVGECGAFDTGHRIPRVVLPVHHAQLIEDTLLEEGAQHAEDRRHGGHAHHDLHDAMDARQLLLRLLTVAMARPMMPPTTILLQPLQPLHVLVELRHNGQIDDLRLGEQLLVGNGVRLGGSLAGGLVVLLVPLPLLFQLTHPRPLVQHRVVTAEVEVVAAGD